MGKGARLEHEEILTLQAAAVSARLALHRTGLLAGLPAHFVASLSQLDAPGEQVLADLDAMNNAGILSDGTVPLAVWLKNALALGAKRREAAVFKRVLDRLTGDNGVSTPAPSPDMELERAFEEPAFEERRAATKASATGKQATGSTGSERDYDVAISFAGEDREYADALASQLKSSGVRVFYDAHEKATLWGKDLYQYLSDLYCNRAHYCVIFLSSHYARKLWTRHELRAAQARAFLERSEYILPVRLDDTNIEGVLHTVGYLRVPPESISDVAHAVLQKLNDDRVPAPDAAPRAIEPRTATSPARAVRITGDEITFDALTSDTPSNRCIVCGVTTDPGRGNVITVRRQRLPARLMLSMWWLLIGWGPGTAVGLLGDKKSEITMTVVIMAFFLPYVTWTVASLINLANSIVVRLPYCGAHFDKRSARDTARPFVGFLRILFGLPPLILLALGIADNAPIVIFPASVLFWGCHRATIALEQWTLALGPRVLRLDGNFVTLGGVSPDFMKP